jgi:hypothetical protein
MAFTWLILLPERFENITGQHGVKHFNAEDGRLLGYCAV